MKHIIIFIFIISIFSCKAQVAPLYMADPELPEGTYYKDLNNDLDKFVGTWEWQENNNSFTIIVQEEEHYFDGEYYLDILIGEYKFIENGLEIINTLPLLDISSIDAYKHNIAGSDILNKDHPLPCDDCSPEERRVELFFNDPNETYRYTNLWLRHRIINGVEQIDARLYGYREIPDNNAIDNGGVPFGEYTLIKVE